MGLFRWELRPMEEGYGTLVLKPLSFGEHTQAD